MPSPKDITGDLGKLRKKGVLPQGQAPTFVPQMLASRERRMAANPVGLLLTTILLSCLALQGVFITWLSLQ